jgi:hypothetical protein
LTKVLLPIAAVAAVFVTAMATQADEDHIQWKRDGAPSETYVTGGGWTLEQSGAAVGLKSARFGPGSMPTIRLEQW